MTELTVSPSYQVTQHRYLSTRSVKRHITVRYNRGKNQLLWFHTAVCVRPTALELPL